MNGFPEYLGVKAFGVKMGVVLPGDDIVEEIYKTVEKCHRDGLINDGDVICVKESVIARAQNNFVSTNEIAEEVKEKLSLTEIDNLGLLYPIASRNRFASILAGFAKAVYAGKITIQFSFPRDCVGNQLAPEDLDEQLKKDLSVDEIRFDEIKKVEFYHPATGINYVKLYSEIIEREGAKSDIFLSNDPKRIIKHEPDGVIVSCIHERDKMLQKIRMVFDNVITLQELFNAPKKSAWSEWGLLGSNLHSDEQIKLPPRESFKVAETIQTRVMEGIGKKVEVLIYGDGAYLDPSTMIYELADPVCSFGHTEGILTKRKGIKYKYFVGLLSTQGKSRDEIEGIIESEKRKTCRIDDISMEGTTPRKMEDIVASLADLVSGSADAGTPLVVVKGIFN